MGSRLTQGVLLIFDYGYPAKEYYHPQRDEGTLACHYRHRRHDRPLILVGLQDLSAHVDFSAVARAGAATGLCLSGFTTQAEFLLATGLLEQLDPSAVGTRSYTVRAQQVKRLILPGEMGEAIKVLAFTRDYPRPLCGFAGRDLRGRL